MPSRLINLPPTPSHSALLWTRSSRALGCVVLLASLAIISLCGSCATGSKAQASSPAVIDAQRLGDAFSSVAERVSNSVVSIRVEQRKKIQRMPFPFFPFGQRKGPEQGEEEYGIQRGNGSGVIIRKDGYILTNEHVVKGADRIEVLLKSGRTVKGKVVGTDSATDLAVVKINRKSLPALPFGDSGGARVGEWVLAIGSPFGLDYTVTAGVVSAVGRGGIGANEIEDYLQTDASINPGNSGGPLVNLQGQILGINTMIVGKGTGIGFAVPSSLAKQVANQLIRTGTVRRAWIGVSFQELLPELAKQFGLKNTRGALVSEVVPGGPAAKAGMKAGDVIVAVGKKTIRESRDLLREIIATPIGSTVSLKVFREKKYLTIRLKTGERPDQKQLSRNQGGQEPKGASGTKLSKFGLSLETLTPDLAKRLDIKRTGGVVVTSTKPGSPADRAGLRRRDLIVEADRRRVRTPADVGTALSDGKALLRVERAAGAFYVVLTP